MQLRYHGIKEIVPAINRQFVGAGHTMLVLSDKNQEIVEDI